MRRMISSSPAAWRTARSRPGGNSSARRNGAPTRTVTRPPGWAASDPRGHRANDPSDARPARSGTGPMREDRRAVVRIPSRPVPAARALGEDEQDAPFVEDPLAQPVGLDVARAGSTA